MYTGPGVPDIALRTASRDFVGLVGSIRSKNLTEPRISGSW
jgi:hypothetical protein